MCGRCNLDNHPVEDGNAAYSDMGLAVSDAGLGSASAILEGDAHHPPRDCVGETPGMAEVLSVWRRRPGDEKGTPL